MKICRSIHSRTWKMLIMPPFMLLLVSVVFGIVFYLSTAGDSPSIPRYFQSYTPLILAINHISLFFILRFFLKKDNLTLRDIGLYVDRKKWPIEVVAGLVLGFVLYFFNELIIEPIQAVYRGNPAGFSIELKIRDRINWSFLAAAATLPVVEELIYRGYAYSGFKNKYSLWFTIIASSILFGALHWGLGVLTAILIIPFGIILFAAFLYRKRNLVAVTIGHCLYNSLVLILI